VKEDELAAAERERGKICGGGFDQGIGGVEGELVNIDFCRSCVGAEEAIGPSTSSPGANPLVTMPAS